MIRAEIFVVAPEARASFAPKGTPLLAVSLPSWRQVDPTCRGALALPLWGGVDRFVGLYPEHGPDERPPFGPDRVRLARVQRDADPLIRSLCGVALGTWEDVGEAGSPYLQATGEADFEERARILTVIWRAVAEQRALGFESRIGGRLDGRRRDGVIRELGLKDGRTLVGSIEIGDRVHRGGLSLGWITAARILDGAPCHA